MRKTSLPAIVGQRTAVNGHCGAGCDAGCAKTVATASQGGAGGRYLVGSHTECFPSTQSQEDRPPSRRPWRERLWWQRESVPCPFSPFLILRPVPWSKESHVNSTTAVTWGSANTSRWRSLRWSSDSFVWMSLEDVSCFNLINFNEISSKPANLFLFLFFWGLVILQ